jgi:hypothetical protein
MIRPIDTSIGQACSYTAVGTVLDCCGTARRRNISAGTVQPRISYQRASGSCDRASQLSGLLRKNLEYIRGHVMRA